MILRHALAVLLLYVLVLPVRAGELPATEPLGAGVFALIGETGARTYENHGLNANFGVVDTAEGAILIDSGASLEGAKLLADRAQALTGKPVKWVINTGSQDHRWLGNGWFRTRGVEVIALARTVATQQAHRLAQLDALRPVLKERLAGTEPAYASRVVEADAAKLVLGGRVLELRYFTDAHFSGDAVVWLPAERIAFAGDHVYADRLLGILPQSVAASWLKAFHGLEALEPAIVVPGHGRVTDLAGARRDTGDYLVFLTEGVQRFAEDMAGVEEAVAALGDAPQFARLANYAELHRGNVSRAYLRVEAAQ